MEGYFQISNKLMKCSTASVVREKKIEITMFYLHIPAEVANVRKADTTKIG